MAELSPLLERFYKEADIPTLWKGAQRDIDHYVDRYHNLVADAVLQVNVYLRQQTSGYTGRRFQIFLELLAAPNQVQARTYGNEDFIVISPSRDPHIFEIRHAYLRYLLDPMATHYRETIERKKALADHLQRVRALPDAYKDDFLEVTTESLIRAVESRLDHKPQMVQEALLDGYILAPYFATLPRFEKQEQSMLVYYPEMIGAIDLVRRGHTADAGAVQQAAFGCAAAEEGSARAARAYGRGQDPGRRRESLPRAGSRPRQPGEIQEALSGGAAAGRRKSRGGRPPTMGWRASRCSPRADTAEKLFTKLLDLQPEQSVKAWSLVYLGKLSLAAGETEAAVKFFQSALQVDGASPKAREEARTGVQRNSKK